jgi:signal transduction histidine kinase
VCNSFAELYRVGLKVLDAEGNKLVDVKVGNADFCGYLWQNPEARAQCTATIQRLKTLELSDTVRAASCDCFSGCRYLVRAVLYEGDVLGRVVFGPFIPSELVQLPESLRTVAPGVDLAAAAPLMQTIRRVSQPTAEKIVQHFAELLDVLVFSGHKNLVTAQLHIEAVQENYRELQEKNRQLENSLAKVKELDRLKSNFLATMSHELRTPLTSVIGYSEMMLEGLGGPLTKEQREYVGIIMEKGENLLQLITSVLDITKVEAGRLRLTLAAVDLGALIREAVSTLLPLARKKTIDVACSATEGLPAVECDSDKIRQCLLNLVSNAIKFTNPGGGVNVSASVHGDKVVVAVSDTGIGIADEHLPRVWDVFYQVDGSATREYGGAGIGLAIVKSFVEAHGGEVIATSKANAGSTFSFVLPVRAAVIGAGSLGEKKQVRAVS